MNTYIVLFRGINVGGKNILPMKDLKDTLTRVGFEAIKSYIQSGNLILQSAEIKASKIAQQICLAVEKNFSFSPTVLVLDIRGLQKAINNNPFSTEDGKRLHFYFMDSKPKNPDLKVIAELKIESEQYELKDNVFYLFAPQGIGRSKLAARIERAMGVPATARNWNTVSKLSSMSNE